MIKKVNYIISPNNINMGEILNLTTLNIKFDEIKLNYLIILTIQIC